MLGLDNARLNALEAENRRLRDDLLAQTQRANALRALLCQAWREHGVQAPDMPTGGTVTVEAALARLCWN